MKILISCAYNMDNCCVELKFSDGSKGHRAYSQSRQQRTFCGRRRCGSADSSPFADYGGRYCGVPLWHPLFQREQHLGHRANLCGYCPGQLWFQRPVESTARVASSWAGFDYYKSNKIELTKRKQPEVSIGLARKPFAKKGPL